MHHPRILVVGAGAIGAISAAKLKRAGHDVTLLVRSDASKAKLTASGVTIRDGNQLLHVQLPVFATRAEGEFALVLLATQATEAAAGARSIVGNLAANSHVVCMQNGLCEEHVSAVLRAAIPSTSCGIVLGCVVSWGASVAADITYVQTARGHMALGAFAGEPGPTKLERDPTLLRIAHTLSAIAPCRVTSNLPGMRWSKLAQNAAISSLGTLGGDTLGALLRHSFVRTLALEVMTEAVHVAQAKGIHLERVGGTLDLTRIALSEVERAHKSFFSLAAKHAVLLVIGAKYRKLRSSMLRAIEEGKLPAVDFLNGEIVRHGRELGIATPVNAALSAKIWQVARRETHSGLTALRALYAATR